MKGFKATSFYYFNRTNTLLKNVICRYENCFIAITIFRWYYIEVDVIRRPYIQKRILINKRIKRRIILQNFKELGISDKTVKP